MKAIWNDATSEPFGDSAIIRKEKRPTLNRFIVVVQFEIYRAMNRA